MSVTKRETRKGTIRRRDSSAAMNTGFIMAPDATSILMVGKVVHPELPPEELYWSPDQAKAKGLVTRQQLADHLGIPERRVYQWSQNYADFPRMAGRLDAPRYNGHPPLYHIAELAEWVRKHPRLRLS